MKQHNMDIIGYIIMGSFSVILLGAIIYFAFTSFKETQESTDHLVNKTNKILSEGEDADIMMYDNEELRGDEVIYNIKTWLGDYDTSDTAPIYCKVTTVISGTTYTNTYTNNTYISDIENFSSLQYYIKPTAYFDCKVVKSENKAILGVTFVQK